MARLAQVAPLGRLAWWTLSLPSLLSLGRLGREVAYISDTCRSSRHMSVVVQVFGCRHDDAIHALRRPASEKRQGTKSREVGHRRWRRSHGELARGPNLER